MVQLSMIAEARLDTGKLFVGSLFHVSELDLADSVLTKGILPASAGRQVRVRMQGDIAGSPRGGGETVGRIYVTDTYEKAVRWAGTFLQASMTVGEYGPERGDSHPFIIRFDATRYRLLLHRDPHGRRGDYYFSGVKIAPSDFEAIYLLDNSETARGRCGIIEDLINIPQLFDFLRVLFVGRRRITQVFDMDLLREVRKIVPNMFGLDFEEYMHLLSVNDLRELSGGSGYMRRLCDAEIARRFKDTV